uniref:Putative beta beta-carotene n=2 Tax=Rhodnius TaxID=13248 RepID=A0A4V0Y8M6_RHOPR
MQPTQWVLFLSSGLKSQIIKINLKDALPGQEYKNGSVVATIPCRWRTTISYSHSFGISQNYVVYIDQPLFMAGVKLLTAHVKGHCMIDCMEWKPEEKNHFVVVDKETGDVSSILYESAEAFFFFHHINTYQIGQELVVDVVAHNSPEVIKYMYLNKLRNAELILKDQGNARRFVLPLIKNIKDVPENENLIKCNSNAKAVRKGNRIIVTSTDVTEPAYDFPTVNPAYFGKRYTYFYASGNYTQSQFRNSVLKVNVDTGEIKTWKESELVFPAEPLFVASPGCKAEDDGVLLVGVTNLEKDGKDFLLILDATDLHELARATVNAHVPFLLHTTFLPVI